MAEIETWKLIIGGIALLLSLLPQFVLSLLALATLRWRPVPGMIVRVRQGRLSSGWRLGWARLPDVRLRYCYEVEGRRYHGTAVSLLSLVDTAGWGVRRLLKKYPSGSPVTVYHCPNDPARACLVRGLGSPMTILMLLLSQALLIWGLILIGLELAKR